MDDEEDFVATMVKRLERRGLSCQGATSGPEAVRRIADEDYDVVLLDVKIPGMDGVEILRRIKAARPATQVVMLTGHASVEAGRAGLAQGACDYLLKPVELESLYEALCGAMNDRASQGATAAGERRSDEREKGAPRRGWRG
ncbi:MAG: response regulator [Thermodesulfobacteriota bacterium]